MLTVSELEGLRVVVHTVAPVEHKYLTNKPPRTLHVRDMDTVIWSNLNAV